MTGKPANEKAYEGLLVGGYHSPHYIELRPKLLKDFGVDLVNHWETGLSQRALQEKKFPKGCEVVVVLGDAFFHSVSIMWNKAIADKVPLAIIGRNKPDFVAGMIRAGFPPDPQWRKPPIQGQLISTQPLLAQPKTGFLQYRNPVVENRVHPSFDNAPPPAVSDAAIAAIQPPILPALPGIWVGERYVKISRKWDDAAQDTFITLAEAQTSNDALAFCAALEKAIGVYRFPAALCVRLRGLGNRCKASHDLKSNLEKAAQVLAQKKKGFLKEEEERWKKHGEKGLADWISSTIVERLMGGIIRRMPEEHARKDKLTACRVFRRDDVLAQRSLLLESCGRDRLNKRRLGGPVRSIEEVTASLLKIITENPGVSRSTLERHSGTDRKRAAEVISKMVQEGKLIYIDHPIRSGSKLYGPPGWVYVPPVKQEKKVSTAAVEAPPATPVAAAVMTSVYDSNRDYANEIYRAIRERQITTTQGREMLRDLEHKK